jgi:hypothetical protein
MSPFELSAAVRLHQGVKEVSECSLLLINHINGYLSWCGSSCDNLTEKAGGKLPSNGLVILMSESNFQLTSLIRFDVSGPTVDASTYDLPGCILSNTPPGPKATCRQIKDVC